MEITTLRIIRLPAGKLGFRDIAKKIVICSRVELQWDGPLIT